MKENPIGFIDSGLGGISVLKEVYRVLPFENYIYYGDSLHNPYGLKCKEELYSIVNHIVQFLLSKNCKMIVLACNTATMMVIDELRKNYKDVLFVGTEPAIKVAHDFYPEKRVLVLATPGTIQSEKLQELRTKYVVPNASFLACSGLAELIEKGDDNLISDYLEKHIRPYRGKVDVVVLGCTHYPFIQKELKEVLGDVTFLDGSKGIAKRVEQLLKEKNLLCDQQKATVTFVNSLGDEPLHRSQELFYGEAR